MFDKLEIFRMSQGLAQHAAARQSTIAQNVANADTPGYRARDLVSFSETYDAPDGTEMRRSRAKHALTPSENPGQAPQSILRDGPTSPNGNSVSLETELMASASAKRDHDLALAVYKSSMNIMRAAVSGR
ncbi:flagellar basal-body rod protein FlgB [Aliiroseovarius crassostreae]|uniref:Flagellar basal body rod protein FlgB n=1 Tax=Aliiroseovarius crassostreae TaxID=154981 RepID=A0A0P7KLG3_9RHOB|nr:FlgB family protein [Aliiroseovarius crassostreae]KPN64845.1 flagellar biosynthesis protein FlgB [Aliiroseovarius crassostreae]SFU83643.1 flagellar basal-body rod protein FlgB [Aliiroseovarius crassostreae]